MYTFIQKKTPSIKRIGIISGCTLMILLVLGNIQVEAQLFVDADATGDNDGSSWENAYTDLQDALNVATSGEGIYVAEGIYKPVIPADPNNVTSTEREASFVIPNGVEIYGGFDPGEGVDTFAERDWVSYPTILSGDIDNNDATTNGIVTDTDNITGDNSYNVVTSSGNNNFTYFDGFIITAGLANAGTLPNNVGGGMYINNGGSPVLKNLKFIGNFANTQGGGIYNFGSSPRLTDISFSNNSSGVDGGGMKNRSNASPILNRVIFSENNADDDGGGLSNTGSSPELTDVIFINNTSQTGAGMANFSSSSPILRNVIINGNTSSQWGGGMHNDNSSPVLVNVVITGNTSNRPGEQGGGGMRNRNASNPVMTNVVIWDNQSNAVFSESLFNSEGSVPVISNSLIEHSGGSSNWDSDYGTINGSNLDTNPLFVDPADPDGADNVFFTSDDGLALQIGSPAINAGTNAPYETGGAAIGVTTDLAGGDRIFNGETVDMGPYEFQGDGVISGSPAVDIAFVENAGWRMMGVPVTGATVADLAGINLVQGISGLPYDTFEPNVYVWNLNADTPDFGYSAGAYETPASGTTELSPGTGFIWYMYGPEANPDVPESKTFPLTIQLSGDEIPGDVSLGTLAADWHLIANPFIQDISFTEITDGTGSSLNIAGQIWSPNSGSEGSYVSTVQVDNLLSAWQGAFINLSSPTEVVIPQSAKSTGAMFLKEQGLPLAGQVEFMLEGELNGESIVDKAAILYFHENASEEWDGYDVPKLTPLSQSWATVNLVGDRESEPLYKSLHSLPYDFTGTEEIPVDIQLQNTSGTFTLSWPVVSNLPQAELWLVDRQTGERYDLNRPGSVEFVAEAGKQASAFVETNPLKLPEPEPMRFKQNSEPRFVIQVNPEAFREELPAEFTLNQNYPNPFNPTTVISYELPEAADVRLQVFDMAGRQVATLVNDQVSAGRHTVNFDAGSLSSGVYMYRLQTQSGIITKKLTLIK
jgi:hypothetical protein